MQCKIIHKKEETTEIGQENHFEYPDDCFQELKGDGKCTLKIFL